MKKYFLIISILLFILVTSCTRQVAWVGMNYGNTFSATYMFFDGMQTEQICLDAGDTLVLEYEIDVEEGELSLRFEDPNRSTIWESTFMSQEKDVFEFIAEKSGRYFLRVMGDKNKGGFDLQWQIVK